MLDYGLDFAEVPLFDGQYRHENRSNMLNFRSVYGTLISSVINPNASISHLKDFNQTLESELQSHPEDITLSVLLADYQRTAVSTKKSGK